MSTRRATVATPASEPFRLVNRAEYRQQSGFVLALALGAFVGLGFAGYMLKSPAAAVPAVPAVAALDYAAITAAVKAGVAAALPTAAPAPAAPAVRTVIKRKVVVRRAARPAVYIVRYAAPACSCML